MPDPSVDPEFPPPSRHRIGRYVLLESLGKGGMGEVHRARAFAAAGVVKDLCIKRVRASRLRRSRAVERFVAEARVSMQLSHGNIVSVFDFGRAADEYYLAMEWVDGADLRDILAHVSQRHQRLPPSVAAHVAAQVARALDYAHRLVGAQATPLVHRDVKPANVLVSKAGDVKLTDFGVAAAIGAAPEVAGTPAYMAPEQRRGGGATHASDLFALGVVLREMLCGDRETDAEGTRGESVPVALRPLLASLLAEDPEERPGSAKQVAAELESFVGRAGFDGATSPRDVLAELAGEARRLQPAQASSRDHGSEELGPDLSFVTNGDDPAFVAKMWGSTVSENAESVRSAADRGVLPARRPVRASIWVAMALLVAAATGLGLANLAPDGVEAKVRSTHPPPRPTKASQRSERGQRPPPVRPKIASPEPTASRIAEPAAPIPVRRRARPQSSRLPKPDAAGRLNINAVPWAVAFVNGRKIGVTPRFNVSLPPGRHDLRLVNTALGVERHLHVQVEAGADRNVVVDLGNPAAPAPP